MILKKFLKFEKSSLDDSYKKDYYKKMCIGHSMDFYTTRTENLFDVLYHWAENVRYKPFSAQMYIALYPTSIYLFDLIK